MSAPMKLMPAMPPSNMLCGAEHPSATSTATPQTYVTQLNETASCISHAGGAAVGSSLHLACQTCLLRC